VEEGTRPPKKPSVSAIGLDQQPVDDADVLGVAVPLSRPQLVLVPDEDAVPPASTRSRISCDTSRAAVGKRRSRNAALSMWSSCGW
jgi:hypothetical protein